VLNQAPRVSYTRISDPPWVARALRTKSGSDTHPCTQGALPRVCQCGRIVMGEKGTDTQMFEV